MTPSVAGPGLILVMLCNTQSDSAVNGISLGLHKHPRDQSKSLETSDCLIHLKPEKMKVPGLVGIRESGQLEKNLCFGEGF